VSKRKPMKATVTGAYAKCDENDKKIIKIAKIHKRRKTKGKMWTV